VVEGVSAICVARQTRFPPNIPRKGIRRRLEDPTDVEKRKAPGSNGTAP
jgi:hypothetical protein